MMISQEGAPHGESSALIYWMTSITNVRPQARQASVNQDDSPHQNLTVLVLCSLTSNLQKLGKWTCIMHKLPSL